VRPLPPLVEKSAIGNRKSGQSFRFLISDIRFHAAEAALIATALPLYYLVRGVANGDAEAALERGRDIADIEKALGIFWEDDVQNWVLPAEWFTDILNQLYLYWHLPVIGLVALWLYVRSRGCYLLLRNTFLISGGLALVVYLTLPVAPPRLLPEFGFVDTITEQYDTERPGTPGIFVNHYAAVPSLHFGWNVLAGLMPLFVVRNPWTCAFAALMPVVTMASIIMTANHFFLDAAAGLLAVALGAGTALWLRSLVTPGVNSWLAWLAGVPPEAERP
jgi:hypothetical protein